MDFQNIWSISAKDFIIFRRKTYIIYTVFILPLLASIGFPLLLSYVINKGITPKSVEIDTLKKLITYFSFFFVILAGLAPAIIAGYSIVGEKLEKSLEPLLATPVSDREILIGKGFTSFVPILVVMVICYSIYGILVDFITKPIFGYYYLPNEDLILLLTIVIPLTIIFSVEGSVIISSRVNDSRTSSQFGILLMLPFLAIFIMSEAQVITIDTQLLFFLTGGLIIVDIILFYLSSILFEREEILTKWK